MAEKISAYRADDGTVFSTFKEAQEHDVKAQRKSAIETLLDKLDLTNPTVSVFDGQNRVELVPLDEFLEDNHEALVAALSVKAKSWSRKPKQPKAPA